MNRPICRDTQLLSRKAQQAGIMDAGLADDLADTLKVNLDRCVGMAANMIGVPKAIIVFTENGRMRMMLNPVLQSAEGEYEAEEGCLSLYGVRKTKRYKKIRVEWQTSRFETKRQTFTGFTAQIIQHELDHLNGILI